MSDSYLAYESPEQDIAVWFDVPSEVFVKLAINHELYGDEHLYFMTRDHTKAVIVWFKDTYTVVYVKNRTIIREGQLI